MIGYKGEFLRAYQQGCIPLAKEHVFIILSTSLINAHFPNTFNEMKHSQSHRRQQIEQHRQAIYRDTDTDTTPNPTVLSDAFLASVTPIFTIRPPVRMASSSTKI
ncbi:hypothetical protein E1B28_003476 [Marasmius oreades]|uniref:Uncharacterized protein n=1 Tax=Marasmius oreades TaxID=181124 RepID=A0A9P7RN38_9AGAR|nr:uncharacterized protein E1B28_003476 [Marasmius oreades]KAG7085948.1 hypothetical protein E1B28_003476 [Marasmius oreades]